MTDDNAKAIRLLEEWRNEKRHYSIDRYATGRVEVFLIGVTPIKKADSVKSTLLAAVEDALQKWEG